MIPSIKIGPVDYKVRELDDLHCVHDDGKKVELNGHIVYSQAEIRVSTELKGDVKVVCLWHETIHGILCNAAQNVSEDAVIALGYGLVQLIRDNPALIELTVNGQQPPESPETH